MQLLASLDHLQRWLAVRGNIPIPATNKIVNNRRVATEAQVLRIAAAFVCTDEEVAEMRLLDEVETATVSLSRIIARRDVALERIAAETLIALTSIQGFIGNTLAPSEEELLRIFLAVVVRNERRCKVNKIIAAAGDYVLGDVAPA